MEIASLFPDEMSMNGMRAGVGPRRTAGRTVTTE